uniref:Uncharacterized protein n=1 Tax=Anguilla anguilla TaxID=7936 RepID=A0A0E9VU83_ANGAN
MAFFRPNLCTGGLNEFFILVFHGCRKTTVG